MTRAYLALGGNLGDVAAEFATALRALAFAQGVALVALSRVYRTPPWGVTDQPDFLNMAVAIETDLSARALLELCLQIEKTSGRVRDRRWGPRNIDIDVIAFGDAKVNEPDLTIPHPRAHERAFVLAPLAEVAGDLTLGGKRVGDWLAQADASGVQVDEEATAVIASAAKQSRSLT
ncbi:MAG: 2-amino-4-hydroxy-6-hydroxymethyldihydropteridine pyrophosphokinae [Hyphomicrobiales bacterium]|nr:2-amino-4-hydroxy-6-hydroxymethyldihydropteridine pyrophosphokinae [Hyphomicrobiales bacterium]